MSPTPLRLPYITLAGLSLVLALLLSPSGSVRAADPAMDPDAQIEAAKGMAQKGQVGEAVVVLTSVIQGQADKHDKLKATFYRGILNYHLGQIPAAIQDLTAVIKGMPIAHNAYFFRADAHMAQGDTAAAIQDFDAGLQLSPNHIMALLKRGGILIKTHQYERALADLDRVEQLEPGNPGALNNRAWIMATSPEAKYRDGRKALTLVKKALESGEGREVFLDTLAAVYAELGQFDEAIRTQQEALSAATQPAVKKKYQARLEHYRQKKPWRD